MGSQGGFLFTTPEPDKKGDGEEKPKMHFVTDKAWLNEGAGERAGGGAKEGKVTVGLAQLDDLKEAQGILGLSPPFSLIGAGFGGGQGSPSANEQQKSGGNGKGKRDVKTNAASPPAGGGSDDKKGGHESAQPSAKLPSLDVSFLHSYLSPSNREILGMTGSSHFYLDFSPSTILNPVPTGELVFPLTGTTLPTSTSEYNYSASITIDPSSGSTYPSHPFWGIAHRPDLRFFLGDTILPDVRIDAILLDSGTSGIIGPPSEVSKIFTATKNRVVSATPNGGDKVVLGKARCEDNLRMGFEVGVGHRALFESVRRTAQPNGRFVEAKHDVEDWNKRELTDGWVAWKSYADHVHNGIRGFVQGLTDWIHLFTPGRVAIAKRHLHGHRRMRRQLLQVGTDLLDNGNGAPAQDNAAGGDGADDKQCQVSLMGSPQVEKMFPSNGPNFKVWILGLEFFQSNLVYHNLDTAQTVIVPRNSPA